MTASLASPIRSVRVCVQTGTHLFAGTDARVWVQLGGPERRTQWLQLQPEIGGFARGERSEAQLHIAAHLLPERIDRVALMHDASGLNRSWYVDHVEVDGHRFALDCWLSREEAPYRLDAAALPEAASRAYTVRLHTTATFLAGTDAEVYVQLIGERETTAWMRLAEPGVNNFEHGNVDAFRVWAQDIGPLVGVWVRHDNSGIAPGWHLARIEVDDKRIEVGRWLANTHGAGTLDHLWRARPYLRNCEPLRFRLITFADIYDRARITAASDIGHAGVLFERYGIRVELLQDDQDVVFDEQWLSFDARHVGPEPLVRGLLDALATSRPSPSNDRVIPLFYVGAFEGHDGLFPCLAQPGAGIFMPLKRHPDVTLGHEIGHFFGLAHTATREADGRVCTKNPADVIENDPLNPMSFSELPSSRQMFTSGQLDTMVLPLLRHVGPDPGQP